LPVRCKPASNGWEWKKQKGAEDAMKWLQEEEELTDEEVGEED
jgi:hypothetical protein